MQNDFSLEHFKVPPHPKGISLRGKLVSLEPFSITQHARELFDAYALDAEGDIWKYLPYGPFKTFDEFCAWWDAEMAKDEAVFFAIIRHSDAKVVGVASYLRINQADASIEVGGIAYSPLLQRTTLATEAMYLMMKWVFENGYRRYEWRCNALNTKSRKAAQRLGFSYEGVFRQMCIAKGKNRNTAWFAAIDKEWASLEKCFQQYLSLDNFDSEGNQKLSLSNLTKPILYKLDNLEFS